MIKQDESQVIFDSRFKNIYDETFHGTHQGAETLQKNISENAQEEHCEREIFLACSGKGPFLFDGISFELEGHEAFFINSWVPHQRSYNINHPPCCHLWFHLHTNKFLGSVVSISENGEHQNRNFVLPADLLPVVERRWDIAADLKDISEKHSLYRGIIRILLDEFALQNKKIIAYPTGEKLVQGIENYLEVNYGHRIRIDELAKIFRTNRFQLMRLFKKHRNITIGDYIDNQRMEFIKKAQAKGLSQKEISWQLGFSSPSAFYLWKKRKEKKCPSAKINPYTELNQNN